MGLTAKQQRFVEEYLVDLNATQAAIRAGYSEHTAQEIGSQNLSKLLVAEEIQKLMEERSSKLDLTAKNILEDIIATRKAAAEDDKHADRNKSNELLGKYLKMWTEKTEVTGRDGKPLDININTSDTDKAIIARYLKQKEDSSD